MDSQKNIRVIPLLNSIQAEIEHWITLFEVLIEQQNWS